MTNKEAELVALIEKLMSGYAVLQSVVQEHGNTPAAIEIQDIRSQTKQKIEEIKKMENVKPVEKKENVAVSSANNVAVSSANTKNNVSSKGK